MSSLLSKATQLHFDRENEGIIELKRVIYKYWDILQNHSIPIKD